MIKPHNVVRPFQTHLRSCRVPVLSDRLGLTRPGYQ